MDWRGILRAPLARELKNTYHGAPRVINHNHAKGTMSGDDDGVERRVHELERGVQEINRKLLGLLMLGKVQNANLAALAEIVESGSLVVERPFGASAAPFHNN